MSVEVSKIQGSTRRVPNIRKFRKDKYHPNCYNDEDSSKKSEGDKGDKVSEKGKKTVNLISHDLIRTIIIPSEDEIAKKSVFSTDEFNRLQKKSKFLTPKERTELIEQAKAEKIKKITESAIRKKELQSYDKIRAHGAKLSEVEAEASRKANHLLTRAFELRQEQEDEIKKCNALILGTKCHAIRDAQIAEKKLIQKELSEEEKRLEEMMEQERQRGLLEQEKLKEREQTKKQIYVKSIMEQIKENELEKEIEMERIEEERRLANEAAMQIQLDEIKLMKKKIEEQNKIRDEMNKVNQQLHYLSNIEREENRLADLKVQEFMRRKAEAEAARERELEQQHLQREIELARLRAMQEHAADTQAAKDEINAIRIQDEVEREWRKKERDAALKRAKNTEELKKARDQQVLDRRKCQAIELQKEKEEAEKIARVNQEALEREKEEQHRKLCLMEKHRMELLKQIGEKEKSKIKTRQELFEEGLALKMEQQKREEMLKDTMLKKMAMIRAHKVPEKYVREVERQLKIYEEN